MTPNDVKRDRDKNDVFYDASRELRELDAGGGPSPSVIPPNSTNDNNNSTSPTPSLPPPPANNGAVIAGVVMFLLAAAAAAACIWFIKRQKSRRRRRQYMAAARKASQAQEAVDLDKPRRDSGKAGEEEEEENDDDVILQNVNQVFENPPLQLKEPTTEVSFGDRVVNSVLHLFGSKVPLGAARVRTTTGGFDTASGGGGGGGGEGKEEEAEPIVVNGRIQALYDEIMKPEQPKAGDYGILQEEVTPEAARRSSARRSTSFRPASELSTVSEVSLELMDREISTQLMDRNGVDGAGVNSSGLEQNHLDLILERNHGGDNDSLGLIGGSLNELAGESLGGQAGGLASGLAGESLGELAIPSLGGLADELESSLPAGAAAAGAGTEISSTGFITDRQNPNKYYSIAYTEYYLDD